MVSARLAQGILRRARKDPFTRSQTHRSGGLCGLFRLHPNRGLYVDYMSMRFSHAAWEKRRRIFAAATKNNRQSMSNASRVQPSCGLQGTQAGS